MKSGAPDRVAPVTIYSKQLETSHMSQSVKTYVTQSSGGSKKIIKNEDLFFFYNFVVKNVLFANMYIQHSLTKYGFWSTSEVI